MTVLSLQEGTLVYEWHEQGKQKRLGKITKQDRREGNIEISLLFRHIHHSFRTEDARLLSSSSLAIASTFNPCGYLSIHRFTSYSIHISFPAITSTYHFFPLNSYSINLSPPSI